jgi:hypothetical protein
MRKDVTDSHTSNTTRVVIVTSAVGKMKITELSTESNPVSATMLSNTPSSNDHMTKFQEILSNISSENLWESYDEYCREMTPVTWSTLDQKRLISMDYISNKFMQLHQIDHTYCHSSPQEIMRYLPKLRSQDYLLDYLEITGNRFEEVFASLSSSLSFQGGRSNSSHLPR